MVAPSKRIVVALTLACALSAMLAAVRPAPAAAGDGQGTQTGAAASCIVGHRFEPGPIVDGHYRQPTPAEFEARRRELRALSERSSCSAPPVASTAGDMASGARPASALPVTQR